jgi:hypothetical protein
MAEHRRTMSVLALAAAGALALGACGGGGGGDDRLLPRDLDSVMEEVTTTTLPPPEVSDVDLELPRETTFAGATWSVDQVQYRTAGMDPETRAILGPAAIVTFTVTNTGDMPHDLEVASELVSLLDGEGHRVETAMDGLEPATVAANGESDFEATFGLEDETTAEDLADYSFQVGDEQVEPGIVPLSGEAPDLPYPITVKLPAKVEGYLLTVGVPGSGLRGRATLRPLDATVRLDYEGEQARKGTRFLVLRGAVDIHEGRQSNLGRDDLRTSVDGIVMNVADSVMPPAGTTLAAGATGEATWVYTVPSDGRAGALVFGSKSDPSTKGTAFSLPAMP